MAFHSVQGPQQGLPQLVQSRPQFGYIGAAYTVWIFALINYIAFNTSDTLLAGDAIHTLFGGQKSDLHVLGMTVAGLVATVIALFGYRWIHRINQWLAIPLFLLLLVLSYVGFQNPNLPPQALELGPFELAPFMTAFVIVSGFQITWAPYVSDYSRYLPASTSAKASFWWTFLPAASSTVWVFMLGAVIMSAAEPGTLPVAAIKAVGDTLFAGFGAICVIVFLVSLISMMAINQYGGMMSIISIWDSFRPVRPTRKIRAVAISMMFLIVWLISLRIGIKQFEMFYANVLIFLAYLFTPWTAINLVDYFFVRRGVYVIPEIFNPNGIYGRWGWRGNLAYLITIVVMIPFMVTTPFTGFMAIFLGGIDFAMFIGLPLAGGLYVLFAP